MKTIHKILLVLAVLVLICGYMVYDAVAIAPKRYTIRYENLSSDLIPKQMDDISILFFSDLEYGTFMNQERLERLVAAVNSVSPDIVIFGGDVFDETVPVSDEGTATVTEYFSLIKAPLGKFAVFGDNDKRSEQMAETVSSIMYDSDFEMLVNRSVLLRNTGSQSITLVGLDNGLNGQPNAETAYANVSSESYVITVCHTPDTVSAVPGDLTDYFLAGHSHGGQAYFFFTADYTPEKASDYLRGKHSINGNFILDITNGTGTTGRDVRFLSDAEVVLYRLHHTGADAEAPAVTEEPSDEAEPAAEVTEENTSAEEETEDESAEVSEDTVTEEESAEEQ